MKGQDGKMKMDTCDRVKEVEDALNLLIADQQELEAQFPNWGLSSVDKRFSRELRFIADRIVLSAQRLKRVVRQETDYDY